MKALIAVLGAVILSGCMQTTTVVTTTHHDHGTTTVTTTRPISYQMCETESGRMIGCWPITADHYNHNTVTARVIRVSPERRKVTDCYSSTRGNCHVTTAPSGRYEVTLRTSDYQFCYVNTYTHVRYGDMWEVRR